MRQFWNAALRMSAGQLQEDFYLMFLGGWAVSVFILYVYKSLSTNLSTVAIVTYENGSASGSCLFLEIVLGGMACADQFPFVDSLLLESTHAVLPRRFEISSNVVRYRGCNPVGLCHCIFLGLGV